MDLRSWLHARAGWDVMIERLRGRALDGGTAFRARAVMQAVPASAGFRVPLTKR